MLSGYVNNMFSFILLDSCFHICENSATCFPLLKCVYLFSLFWLSEYIHALYASRNICGQIRARTTLANSLSCHFQRFYLFIFFLSRNTSHHLSIFSLFLDYFVISSLNVVRARRFKFAEYLLATGQRPLTFWQLFKCSFFLVCQTLKSIILEWHLSRGIVNGVTHNSV